MACGSLKRAIGWALAAVGLLLAAPGALLAQDFVGDWQGTLSAGGMELRLVVHIARGEDGELRGTLDSVDQGASGIPITSIAVEASRLTLAVDAIGGSFDGVLNDAGVIEGMWAQGPGRLPLALTRATTSTSFELNRPQHPVPPYPYRVEDVEVAHAAAGITLAGTLTIPEGPGPFPAVLLLTGSGPQDRDESLMGHRPFLVLADHLTRRGIAVLRTDDRGVGQSTGTFASATMEDFAADAAASVAFMRSRPEIDAAKLGLVGHSEGGVVAPMLAARDREIAFLVLMAGTGVPGDQVIVAQSVLMARAMGVTSEVAERNAAVLRGALDIVKQGGDLPVLQERLADHLLDAIPPEQLGAQIAALTSPWFRHFIAYDPAPALRQVACPVLAINGQRDLQVPPDQNLAAIRGALEAGGNRSVVVRELPGLNHLFQTARTGAPAEYATIEETMSPQALETISGWILEQ